MYHDLRWSSLAYIVSRLRLPQANVLRGQANNVAGLVDDTGSRTAGADVNANVMVHLDVNFVSVVKRVLTRGRSHAAIGGRTEGQWGRHGGWEDVVVRR